MWGCRRGLLRGHPSPMVPSPPVTSSPGQAGASQGVPGLSHGLPPVGLPGAWGHRCLLCPAPGVPRTRTRGVFSWDEPLGRIEGLPAGLGCPCVGSAPPEQRQCRYLRHPCAP